MLMLMSAVETGQMSAAESGQMSAVETRQMYSIQTGLRPVSIVDICTEQASASAFITQHQHQQSAFAGGCDSSRLLARTSGYSEFGF